MQDRVQHHILPSHHGVMAVGVVSILQASGHCDGDNDRLRKTTKCDNCLHDQHHSWILSLLSSQLKPISHRSVYRVNMSMFHPLLRALVISRLVSEMHPPNDNKTMKNNLHHVGAVVRAALTYVERQEHAPLDQMLGMEESEVESHNCMSK